ncbi:MAG: acyl carrier protein [Bacteroidetes bacterium]|nr:acyl carrier protein [Bacteroidota bacterium]
MIDRTDFADLLRGHLSVLLDIPLDEIEDDTQFADLGVDSLMSMELVVYVEQKINQEVPEDAVRMLTCINDVVNYAVDHE